MRCVGVVPIAATFLVRFSSVQRSARTRRSCHRNLTRTTLGTLFASSSSSSSSDNRIDTAGIIPRAAVSTVVRYNGSPPQYLLIQRGKAPNQGQWSFPGGKLEYGETALQGALRELREETKGWPGSYHNKNNDNDNDNDMPLQWHSDGPFCTSDSIGDGYHYLIAQCFASLEPTATAPPILQPADDADQAAWFTRSEIDTKSRQNLVTPGILQVIDRTERLWEAGILYNTTK